jgi:hypothetical protein
MTNETTSMFHHGEEICHSFFLAVMTGQANVAFSFSKQKEPDERIL